MRARNNSPQNAFEAVIFDCDGVLVDSEIVGLNESSVYLTQFGLYWSPAQLVERFSGLRDDQFFELLSTAYRAANGSDPAESFFTGLYDQRRLSETPIRAMAGVRSALEQIDVPIAVASSSRTDRLEEKLKKTHLWPLLAPHIYSADRVDRGKPDPAIYCYTARQIGVQASGCLVLEDSANGVQSGIEAGMTVWGFVGGGHCFDGHAERLIDAGASWVAQDYADFTAKLLGAETDA